MFHSAAVSDFLVAGTYAPTPGSRARQSGDQIVWEGNPPSLTSAAAGSQKVAKLRRVNGVGVCLDSYFGIGRDIESAAQAGEQKLEFSGLDRCGSSPAEENAIDLFAGPIWLRPRTAGPKLPRHQSARKRTRTNRHCNGCSRAH